MRKFVIFGNIFAEKFNLIYLLKITGLFNLVAQFNSSDYDYKQEQQKNSSFENLNVVGNSFFRNQSFKIL